MAELGPLPNDVGLRETLAFLDRFRPPERLRVLEVGCGRGELASRLSTYGWDVTAIDPDARLVEVARAAGVQAWPIGLLDFEATLPFDAVLVSRALHGEPALDAALDRLARLVRPGGWLFVDEWAKEEAGPREARWLYERRDLLEEAGPLQARGPRLEPVNPLTRWEAEHGGRALHAGSAIKGGIEVRFEVLFCERVPYLYRILCADLEATPAGHRLAKLLLEQEQRRIEEGELRPLGLRIAAQRPV